MSALELYTNELCHEHKPSETLCECQVLSNALLSQNDGCREGSLDFAVMEKWVFGDSLIPLQL